MEWISDYTNVQTNQTKPNCIVQNLQNLAVSASRPYTHAILPRRRREQNIYKIMHTGRYAQETDQTTRELQSLYLKLIKE